MHRGARRAPVFHEDAHCHLFLDLLASAVRDFDVEVHAYSLMPNHYHLLVRSRHGNLSRAMRQLNAGYTQRLNLVRGWDGPVFRGRFRSELIENEASLPYVMAYIHLNPMKAGLITRLQSQGWTSHRAYVGRDAGPPWLTTAHFEAVFDDPDELHEYVLDLHRGKRSWPERMAMDSGWLRQSGERAVTELAEPAERRFPSAIEVLARVCAITGAGETRLREAVKGPRANPARRFAVWALKRGTLMTHREIGAVLGMTEAQVAQVLRRLEAKAEPMGSWIARWRSEAMCQV
jgi:REP element-mobilizing transposase RayT